LGKFNTMNNKILNLALAVGQVMRSFLIFILIVVVLAGILLVIDTDALPFLRYENGAFNFSGQTATDEVGFRPEGWYILFTFIKLAATIFCSVLIINELIKVIQSIRSLDTFKEKNILAFRRMASIFIALFFIHVFSLTQTEEQFSFSLSLPLQYLLGVIACYILAEIFKEGNRLMEENQLTI